MMERADTHDSVVVKASKEINKAIQETIISAHAARVNLHVTDWVTSQ